MPTRKFDDLKDDMSLWRRVKLQVMVRLIVFRLMMEGLFILTLTWILDSFFSLKEWVQHKIPWNRR